MVSMKKKLLILSCVLCSAIVSAQPVIQWQKTIGGSDLDELISVQQTADHGFILGGLSRSNISGIKSENSQGALDYWVVKLDSSGNIEWQNTIGGNDDEELFSVAQTSDGGYILGGVSESDISGDKTENHIGSYDYWVVKLDAGGNIQWQNTIGGTGDDRLYSVSQTVDGGYILGGWSLSNISGDKTENSNGSWDYWVLKLDNTGNIQWQNTIGGSNGDYLYSVRQTQDGGYILGGASDSNISGDKTENTNGGRDYWVVKLDANGVVQWQNTIGGNLDDMLYSLYQTSDGGYILGGSSLSAISGDKTENCWGNNDFWIVKINSTGVIEWENTIGGSDDDRLWSIQQTTDGGYVAGGWSRSNISGDKTDNSNGSNDYWIVKINPSGNIQWQDAIGGSSDDRAWSIQQTADGGFVLAGESTSGISGDKTENSYGDIDYWVVKLAPDFSTDVKENSNQSAMFDIFPNPANDVVIVRLPQADVVTGELHVFNLLGKEVIQEKLSGEKEILFNISEFAEGVYVFEIKTQQNIYQAKFLKQ